MPVKDIASAKVTTIVTPEQLGLNVGSNFDIQVGDTVALFRLVKIYDPDSKELLGAVRLTKLSLRVTLVSDRFSVATVTDRVPLAPTQKLSAIPRPAPLKTVTSDKLTDDNDPAQVFVSIGEEAQIRRLIREQELAQDEPPF